MEFHLSTILVFLALTLVASYAVPPLPPEVYWNSILPHTPMPKSISELVNPEGYTIEIISPENNCKSHNDIDNHDLIRLTNTTTFSTNRFHSIDTASDDTLENSQVSDTSAAEVAADGTWMYCFAEEDAPAQNQVPDVDDPARRVFFLEKEIQPGTTMKYRLAGFSPKATFRSRKDAEAVPFSSSKLPAILNKLSVKLGSNEAEMIKDTIVHCEYAALGGEERYCPTSLESMIDFITSMLGRNVQAISTEVEKGGTALRNYTIMPGVEKLATNEMIACHKLNYPYALFYCHKFANARAYRVPLQGADGTKAAAVAVCHGDTSKWGRNHYAFRELNVKRGTVPICHFLRVMNVVWLRNQKHT